MIYFEQNVGNFGLAMAVLVMLLSTALYFVNKTTLTIIYHYSVSVIYDLSKARRST